MIIEHLAVTPLNTRSSLKTEQIVTSQFWHDFSATNQKCDAVHFLGKTVSLYHIGLYQSSKIYRSSVVFSWLWCQSISETQKEEEFSPLSVWMYSDISFREMRVQYVTIKPFYSVCATPSCCQPRCTSPLPHLSFCFCQQILGGPSSNTNSAPLFKAEELVLLAPARVSLMLLQRQFKTNNPAFFHSGSERTMWK